ncbi:flavin reductase family protein [Aliiroseovarius subalbicans]|uniref:flavin reductase family protein n=1 Tax=Aliiroseovarius subalbicans TaxID=2925840 RepID=UPI001F56C5E0|nr:flavin reductase family protein [Aliiroseovarius subalbicans]MCI2398105.1 flavin reductase family protein [Aliiroseovarius subalbicans]
MKSFTPGPEHAGELRAALGSFTTGVCLITVATEHGPLGMTANSFASVSLNPPLVLWCPAKVSLRHDAFTTAPHFAIHVLSEDQRNVAERFAREGDAFDICDWITGGHDVPLLHGCLARFECATERLIDAGDHSVMLGRVTRVTTEPGAPLAFLGGQYGRFDTQG